MGSNQHSQKSPGDASSDEGTDAAITVLLWLASCDGPLTSREIAAIIRLASGSRSGIRSLVASLERTPMLEYEDVHDSFRKVMELPANRRALLLKAAIAVAITDGEVSPPESHALRLVADACFGGVDGERALAKSFTAAGRRLSPPGDPSDPEWWERHDRMPGQRPSVAQASLTTTRGFRELRDLAVLGLGPNADAAAIRGAFRRSSRLLHPDKLVSEGEGIRSEATAQFQQVREAYERLGGR